MTEQVTSTEFELVVRGQAELREDFKEMSKAHRSDMKSIIAAQAGLGNSQVDLNGKFSRFLDITDGIGVDVSEVKTTLHDPEDGVVVRLRKVEIDQAVAKESNSVKWYLLGAFILAMVTIGGGFAAWITWLIRTVPPAQ